MDTRKSIIKEINETFEYSEFHTWASIKENWGLNGSISIEGEVYEPLQSFFKNGGEIDDSDMFGLIQEASDMDRFFLLKQDIRCDMCFFAC